MPDKKLTDKEIKKALECCINAEYCCECVYTKMCDGTTIHQFALDLINRQKAEIKKLAEQFDKIYEVANGLHKENVSQKAEIERLEKELEDKQFRCDSCDRIALTSSEHRFCVKQAKIEAYKECLGKVEQRDVSESDFYIMIKKTEFNNLLKELAGEDQ